MNPRTGKYKRAFDIFADVGADLLTPPERLKVSTAAERYRVLNNAGAHEGNWSNTKTPYIIEPMDTLRSRLLTGVAFCGPAQSGKALPVDTPIATPDGWTTMGALKVGDTIFGSDGAPQRVVFATPVMYDHVCYRITFDDGTDIVADAEHRWAVADLLAENNKVLTTEQIAATYQFGKKPRSRYAIPVAGALRLPELDLPLDPYVLGAWLGDGNSYHSDFTLHKDEIEIIDRIRAAGHTAETFPVGGTNSVIVKVDSGERHEYTLRRLLDQARVLAHPGFEGSRKRVPASYLRASRAQRLEVLRGLMDTDGYISKLGVCEITNTRWVTAESIVELLTSLGYKTRFSEIGTSCMYKGERVTGTTYQITFVPKPGESVFHLPRKQEMLRARMKATRPGYTGRRFIVGVEEVDSVPVRCIQVDSHDHLFLAGRQMVPTHNTELLLNWVGYSIVVDPMDMLVFCPTQAAARDFSERRIGRMIRHSPSMGAKLRRGRSFDNKFDKHFTNGMILTLSWPSVTELAGRPVPRCALTDYDRMSQDVDGDGAPFDLAQKRNTTFGPFAMTLAESSPSFPILDPRWVRPKDEMHCAPPTDGILSLYNRGDRRRWYWPCPRCGEHFTGRWEHLKWDATETNSIRAAETVHMVCPVCGQRIEPHERDEMNFWGQWVPEGQTIDRNGRLHGSPRRATIASYWLNGVAASFTTWPKLVQTYIDAVAEFERTGNEGALTKFFNTDIGDPYLPKAAALERLPETLKARAQEIGEHVVPAGVRLLVACVDVQKNAFVVQVHGIGPGSPFDITIVDRFTLFKSKRQDDAGDTLWLKPGTYLEDWDIIQEEVMNRLYPLADNPDKRMRVKLTVCDSGGKEGVTTNAYNFYRKLRAEGNAGRFHLLKGVPHPQAPRAAIELPDSKKKDKMAVARGDVPVLYLNSNMLKDAVSHRLDAVSPGTGMVRFPNWLPDWFYNELCAERRTDKGWEHTPGTRNEAFDLLYYCVGACISPILKLEAPNFWTNPPVWASEREDNPMVIGQDKSVAPERKSAYDLAKLGHLLA